jgi:hypothetical protein
MFQTDPPQKKVKEIEVRILREKDYQHLIHIARNAPGKS